MITTIKFDGTGNNLFEALCFSRISTELIKYLIDHFSSLINKIGLNEFIDSFTSTYDKAILINFEILVNIGWKFHILTYLILLYKSQF